MSASSVPLSVPDTALHQAPDTLTARLKGVLRSPRAACAAIAAKPRWAGALALAFVVTFGCSAALLETEVGRLALVDQWERTALAFGQPVDDARYAAFQRASENAAAYAAMSAFARVPLLVVAVCAVVFAVFTGIRRGSGRFRQVLAIGAHAAVILALREVVAAPLGYARETLASPTTMSPFFAMLDEASPAARFFGMIDLFVVWWIAVLAIGMSVLYGRPARPLVLGFLGAYLALAAALAAVMALMGGTT